MNKKENGILGFSDSPPGYVSFGPFARPPPVEASTLKGISIAKDSIQPQVPLRLPCYDFTPVEDPTVVCANKTTKSLCGTSGTQKSWVIIGPMLRAKPIPRV